MNTLKSVGGLLLLALMGCNGDKETAEDTDTGPPDDSLELSCEVIGDENFCWLTSVNEAYACVDTELEGVFDEARSTCTYSDGVTITFDQALPDDIMDDDEYQFVFSILAADGSQCARFVESNAGLELTTSGGTFTETLQGFTGLAIECPTGESYATDDAFALFECESAVFPGFAYSSSDTQLSWSLMGSPEGTFGLINCSFIVEE